VEAVFGRDASSVFPNMNKDDDPMEALKASIGAKRFVSETEVCGGAHRRVSSAVLLHSCPWSGDDGLKCTDAVTSPASSAELHTARLMSR
jgi:hypothetical protein